MLVTWSDQNLSELVTAHSNRPCPVIGSRWYPIVKWRLRQRHSSLSPVRNDQLLNCSLWSVRKVSRVYQSILYHYITPLQSIARGAFYSSRMVCTMQVLCFIVVGWCVLCKCFEGTCGVWADSASGSILRQWDILPAADVCRPGSLMISLSCLMIWVLYSLHGRSVWRQLLNQNKLMRVTNTQIREAIR